MKNKSIFCNLLSVIFTIVFVSCGRDIEYETVLEDHWQIQSSALTFASGQEISTLHYLPDEWYDAKTPSTVFSSLRENGLYKDVFYGEKLRHVLSAPFDTSWWYRTVFNISEEDTTRFIRLFFEGVNDRANVWLNGHQITMADTMQSDNPVTVIDITNRLHSGANVLAVEVLPPINDMNPTVPSGTHPTPPDRNMGIYRPVRLRFSGDVSLGIPRILTKLNLNTLEEADITVSVDVTNHSSREIRGKLLCTLDFNTFGEYVKLLPGETKTVTLTAEKYNHLHILYPRIWWPNTLGLPELYTLTLQFLLDGNISDQRESTFAVRQVDTYSDKNGNGIVRINGKKLFIQGGVWRNDLFLADTPEKLEWQVRYIRHLNLNSIFIPDVKFVNPDLLRLCEEYGILVFTDRKQKIRHSVLNGSIKINPHDFVTFLDPGLLPPDMEILEKILPPENLWPFDDVWAFHSDRDDLKAFTLYKQRLDARYGPSRNLKDFSRKAQVMNYDRTRKLINSFITNSKNRKGFFLQPLNVAWPRVDKIIYSYDLNTSSTFYAVRKAFQPIRLAYNKKNDSVLIVNRSFKTKKQLHVQIRLFDLQLEEIFSKDTTMNVAAQSMRSILADLPLQNRITFLILNLTEKEKFSTRYLYWLPTNEGTTYFEVLNKLPSANIEATYNIKSSASDGTVLVELHNIGNNPAFFIRFELMDDKEHQILPILWSDNYITLLRGESRIIHGEFSSPIRATDYKIKLKGWNVEF